MSLLPVGFGASGDDYEITDSLRLRSSASAYLTRTFSTPTDNKKWTFSFWFKRGALGTVQTILSSTLSGNEDQIYFPGSADTFRFYIDGGIGDAQTVAVFRDPSAWYHMIVVCDTANATATDRAIIYVNGVRQTVTGTNFPLNAVPDINGARLHYFGRYQSGAYYTDGYLTEVNFIDGQALTPSDFGEYDANGTWKAKRYTGTYGNNGFYLPMKPTTQAELQNTVLYAGNTNKQSIDGVGYAPDLVWIKNRTGANNHYLYDTIRGTDRSLLTNATNADNVGAQQLTSFDTDGFTVPYDVSGYNNYAGRNYVAWTWDAGDNQTSTGISSVLYVGQGVAQSVKGFGFSPDLVWIKNLAAASPLLIDSVRGPFLELQPNSTGAETSNNGTRIASIDADGFSFADTAVGGLNQQNNNYVAWGWDAGDGDPVSNTDGSITSTVKASDATGFSVVTYSANGSTGTIGHGLSSAPEFIIVKKRNAAERWTVYHQNTSNAYIYLNETFAAETANANLRFGNNSSVVAPTSSVFTVGNSNDVNGSGGTYVAYCFSEVSGVSKFGTYTGTGSSGKAITGLGFRPGFLMIKETSSTGNWAIVDGTRSPFGEVTGDYLYANLSQAEGGGSAPLQFDSDGFTINSGDSDTNASGQTYIYMAFKGSYSDYVSPLNTTGTIDSRVKANPSKGFSIVSYEGNGTNGATVGHGLSSTPETVIVKDRTNANNWAVYHKDLTSINYSLVLNSSAAQVNYGSSFIAPASSTLSLANGSQLNASSRAYIAYCFAEAAGYSKFDSYTGNGSTTGPVVTTGFRPAFLMVKGTSLTSEWVILDNTRDPNPDPAKNVLMPNNTNADTTAATGLYVNFTDTGFQPVGTGTDTNSSGATYIYMAFADTRDAVFNFDASGNKNNWLPNNINSNAESETTYDLMKDTPSLVDENAANFATLNPLVPSPLLSSATLSEGNLKYTSTDPYDTVLSTIGMTTGKWYFETYLDTAGFQSIGARATPDQFDSNYLGQSGNGGIGYYRPNGAVLNNGVSTSVFSATTGDIIQVALDADNGYLWFGKNNSWYGTVGTSTGRFTLATTDVNPTFFFAQGYRDLRTSNFGQRPFAYTPPTGFLKLNTFNLPDSTIEDGSDYFNIVTFSGNGSAASVTGVGFQPDFIWAKNRTNAYSHELWDAIRGVNSDLQSNTTGAEITDINRLVSFDSDGFSYGTSSNLYVNGTNSVAWNWKANGSGSSNTDGSVTSTVSANTTAGFSVVSYTGNGSNSTVGHGLNTAPEVVIVKDRDRAVDWPIMFKAANNGNGQNGWIRLNLTAAWATTSILWNNTAPTSSVFSIGTYDYVNFNNSKYIAYCFAPVEGYSAFGSYTGNGSTDGPFIYTGFRPSFVIFKSSNQTTNWMMFDTTINPINEAKSQLWPNLANAENTNSVGIDFLSNGIKLRGALTATNAATSYNYIYMAFAENPFKNANAR